MANKKLGIFILVATILVLDTSAYETFDIGGTPGWTLDTDFSDFMKLYETRVGDHLAFKYEPGKHDVLEVDESSYEECKTSNPNAKPLTSGYDVIDLKTPGKHWFICTKDNGNHCKKGMKLAVNALPMLKSGDPASQTEEFIVGDDKGWGVTCVDYQAWAEGKEFDLGDTLVFNYPVGQSNVFRVDEAAFNECKIPPQNEALVTGHDVVTLDSVGGIWFISGVGGQCEKGVKLLVNVICPYAKQLKNSTPALQGSRKLVPPKA